MLFFLGHDLFYSTCMVQIHGTKVDSNSKYSFIHNGALGRRGSCRLSVVRLPAFGGRSTIRLCMQSKAAFASLSASFRARTSSGVCSCSWLCSATIYSWAWDGCPARRPRLILVCRMVSECTVGVREPPPLLSPQLVHLWRPASPVRNLIFILDYCERFTHKLNKIIFYEQW
jgi:hypothetical protein